MSEGAVPSRAAAIRLVADEMDRSCRRPPPPTTRAPARPGDAAPPRRSPPRPPVPAARRRGVSRRRSMRRCSPRGGRRDRRAGGAPLRRRRGARGGDRGRLHPWLARQEWDQAPGPGADVAALEAEIRDLRSELVRVREAIARARAAPRIGRRVRPHAAAPGRPRAPRWPGWPPAVALAEVDDDRRHALEDEGVGERPRRAPASPGSDSVSAMTASRASRLFPQTSTSASRW